MAAAVPPDAADAARIVVKQEMGLDGDGDFEDFGTDVASEVPQPARRAGAKSKAAAKPAAKSAGKVKSGKCKGKGTKFCRGCVCFLPLDMFALAGHALCLKDKRALDNLKGFARRQGQADWMSEVEMDETRLQKLLKEYHARCPERDAKGG